MFFPVSSMLYMSKEEYGVWTKERVATMEESGGWDGRGEMWGEGVVSALVSTSFEKGIMYTSFFARDDVVVSVTIATSFCGPRRLELPPIF